MGKVYIRISYVGLAKRIGIGSLKCLQVFFLNTVVTALQSQSFLTGYNCVNSNKVCTKLSIFIICLVFPSNYLKWSRIHAEFC